ncbi:hypothetical protein FP2506_10351 [Fulvimarina pelagi HTCC2506]|uniref:1,4-alpha-glucan branching enzyme n=1 Tax=Fulvimarina pelagi HTCC2506 TaxID=314231 RepID=Q0G526_9HYPH|nr:hypothetical protein [Fulvimarina pelagi]EAU43238.1 hypothetical protein FP2506_10351 [Fulvimarina pelagi HTCC2506]
MASNKQLTDHDAIKAWAAENKGRPSVVSDTKGDGGSGLLRFDHGQDNDGLEPISWERFFEIFEEQNLALLVDDSGDNSQFSKFVSRT